MTRTDIYKVARHLFSIEQDESSFLWEMMKESYGPFECDEEGERRFSLVVKDTVEVTGKAPVYTNRNDVEEGFLILDVFRTPEGHYFELTNPGSSQVNGCLLVSPDYRNASLALHGNRMEQWYVFNSAVDFCFLLSTAAHDTLLTHSSAVLYQGRAYIFLGKSGTGKSTHSRMWLNALKDVVLMNDDHPVVRLDEDGTPILYGSPWSGKTRCYKNMSAPLGGVVRISRAPHNKARRLAPIQAYASLMTSCSGMTWEKDLADGKDRTLQGIVKRTPCWVMECLPDEDAARVCSEAVTAVHKEG